MTASIGGCGTGRQGKSLSLGVYPKVTLSDARKKRDELRKQLGADLDRRPSEKGRIFVKSQLPGTLSKQSFGSGMESNRIRGYLTMPATLNDVWKTISSVASASVHC
jgi:hypothetical protein